MKILFTLLMFVIGAGMAGADSITIESTEFIYNDAPFPECHASTIAETPKGLIAAWFGGTHEKHKDVGIWVSHKINDEWTEPVEVADGVQHDNKRYPCWNPVLYQAENGSLLLFYKVGPSPQTWWGMIKTSRDHGTTWSRACRLPEDILGPIKNKPILLDNGDLLCPSSTEHDGWTIHLERTPDLGRTWSLIGPINSGETYNAIQPTILLHPGDRLQLLCRSQCGWILESWSRDGGKSWSELQTTQLPNPNSGIDAVTLADGRHVLVYNPTGVIKGTHKGVRTPLSVAVSADGVDWNKILDLETQKGEYSYPAVIQSQDGHVHITYTYKREKIKHVVLDLDN